MQKILIRQLVAIFISITIGSVSWAQSIFLDSSFSSDGKVTTDFGSYDDRAQSIQIQKDAKLVAAGWMYNGISYDIALTRYQPNGELDLTFGNGGKVITALDEYNSRANSLIIQQDGKIVITAEGHHDSLGNTIVLVRYNYDGSIDTSFDLDGKIFTAIGKGPAYGRSLAIQYDGKLIVAGYSKIENSFDFILVRYNTNGSIDDSFGVNGKITTSFGDENDFGNDISIMKDGRIVVVGSSFRDVALARYTSNGILDNTFSSDGKVVTENNCSCKYSLAIQNDNKILVVGEIDSDIGLFRYTTDGNLDNTFGENGKVSTDMNGSYDRGDAIIIQDDGKILVTGQSYGGQYADFPLLRYNQDGSLDTGFDFDGKLTTDFSQYNDEGYSMIIQPDGKIVIAGETSDVSGYDFGIARYNTSELIHVNNEIKIYPNPTLGEVYFNGINIPELYKEKKLYLFDVLGKEINNYLINGNSIDISLLPSGAYILDLGGHIEKIIKLTL